MKQENGLSTSVLLRDIVDAFPRIKKSTTNFMTKMGANSDFLRYSAVPPVPAAATGIATFSNRITKTLSPMLAARYLFASDIMCGVDVWPCLSKVGAIIRSRPIQSLHKSLRKHWDESAPKQFKDHDLSVFGYTENVPENIIYLAWTLDIEPKIIVYDGLDEMRFDNLDMFLSFFLTGKQ